MVDQIVVERLRGLRDQFGVLRPDDVVADAIDPESPLHDYFEWDDASAAAAHRRDQARRLIRSVEVYIHSNSIRVRVPEYVRDPSASSRDQGYIPTAVLRTDKDRSRMSLIRELDRAEAALSRAYSVAAALGLESEIESLLASLRGAREAA